MDLTLRNARLVTDPERLMDIGVHDGHIVALSPDLAPGERDMDVEGCLVSPGFIETHIHLDKSCIMHQCQSHKGDLAEAISEVAKAKRGFTEEDVQTRAERTLRKALVHGTTHMRTQVEVDPVIGLKGFEGIKSAIKTYAWAMDVEICIFPQEGLISNPGTDELMVKALQEGASCVGAAPYVDTDPMGQMDRVFEMAREFDVDIDMHMDFDTSDATMDAEYVCRLTDRYGWGGRVAIGHVSKLSVMDGERLARSARMLADAGVAVTVLPATDLFLMHRDCDHTVPRGMAPVHKLLEYGVNCSLSTNNVLNPFTPFGDCSLIRMANLYANVAQIGQPALLGKCFDMISRRSADLMNLADYGLETGAKADLVVLDTKDPASAIAEIAQLLAGFKAGRQTFLRDRPAVFDPVAQDGKAS